MGNKKAGFTRKKGMARLWELAGLQKGLVMLSVVLSIISMILSFVPCIAVYFIVKELIAHAGNLSGINSSLVIKYGWFAFAGAASSFLIYFAALMCSHIAAFKTLYKIKIDFVRHVASLPMGFHNSNSTGKMRKIIDENIEKLEGFIAHQIPDIAGSFTAPFIVFILLFVIDWRFGIACFIPIVSAYLIQGVAFSGEKTKAFMSKYQDAMEDMNASSVEYVRGISVVKIFGQSVFSFKKFYESIKIYTKFCLGYCIEFKNYMTAFLVVINNVYIFIIPAAIFLAGGADDYVKFVLGAVFYLFFSVMLPASFVKIMYVSNKGLQIADGIERMDKIFAVKPLAETSNPLTSEKNDVSFENVTFSYDAESGVTALSNVSFTAEQGKITALVGPSGSGKSTVAHLIPRFFDICQGEIKIGGINVKNMSTDYLMSKISFVFQDVFLFKQSVLDNILAGNKNARREDVINASKTAQCHDFIEKLPNGYDTVIGDKGIHLSGGERQRIVIARAVLKNSPIIILDEATAFADPDNEHKIQLAFEKLIKDKTIIIIAHRLSTVRHADKIVVLDKGKIAGEGIHEFLLESNSKYKTMWDIHTNAMGWRL
ncbi:MAG: ABC transporter ATP-binding protein/permease [Endomicrobium sp.]|jgi:ATP-binding cassette subfamily B protein|nr:ABC transporter ATP-binding protein/permease [Endomicrobium sp.]